MGQSLDKIKISCMYCADTIATQELDLNCSIGHDTETYKQAVLTDEIIVFESSVNMYESTQPRTKSSHSNKNALKDSDYSLSYFQTHEKLRLHPSEKESFKSSELTNSSTQDNNFFATYHQKRLTNPKPSRHKSRSSNFSRVSINLVDSLRSKL